MKYFLLILFVVTANSYAANYSHIDVVERIGSIDSRDDGDFLMVKGFTEAGTCPQSGGLVIARIRSDNNGDRSFSMALAARLSGKKVKISIDDTKRNAEGDCFLNSLEIRD